MSIAPRLDPYTPPADPEYDLLRYAWRRALSDVDVRSMAYEYRVGIAAVKKGSAPPTEDLEDAWAEFQVRFGTRKPKTEFLKKAKSFGIDKRRRKKA